MREEQPILEYSNWQLATFVTRQNRFIATCTLDGQTIVTHVKNTGRNKELLVPGVMVAIVHSANPARKTAWDLVAVFKAQQQWVNIDSQAPNQVTDDAIRGGVIQLPGIPSVATLQREVVYGASRLDFAGTSGDGQSFFIEVKGVTLENQGHVAFPDAPTTRAVKHVHELTQAVAAGYQAYLCFIIQLHDVIDMTIYQQRAPQLAQAIKAAVAAGVQVVAYRCQVTPGSLTVTDSVPVVLDQPFSETEVSE